MVEALSVYKRSIWAVIAAVWRYAIYIYLPAYLFANGAQNIENINYGGATIELGNVATLFYYITFFGWVVMGLGFAKSMAHKDTPAKPVWQILNLFASIAFWALFIVSGFNSFLVNGNYVGYQIKLVVDITLLFYVNMGKKIFDLLLFVMDLLIKAFKVEPKEEDEDLPKHDSWEEAE